MHEIILDHANHHTYGMSNWFEDFLACIKQRVTIGEASSNVTKLFADDSKITSVINGILKVEKLQKDLDDLDFWCQTWDMKFNVEKCKLMHFGISNPKAN